MSAETPRVHDWVWLDRPPAVEGYAPRRVRLVRSLVGGMVEVSVADKQGQVLVVHRGRLSLPGGGDEGEAGNHCGEDGQRGAAALGVCAGDGRSSAAGGAAESARVDVLGAADAGGNRA